MRYSEKSWNFKQIYASIKAKTLRAEPKVNWEKELGDKNAFRRFQALVMLDYKEQLISDYYKSNNPKLLELLSEFKNLKQIQNKLEDYKQKYRIEGI